MSSKPKLEEVPAAAPAVDDGRGNVRDIAAQGTAPPPAESAAQPAPALPAPEQAPPPPAPAGKNFIASIYPGPGVAIPDAFVTKVHELQTALGMPVWLLLHGEVECPCPVHDPQHFPWNEIAPDMADGFQESFAEIPEEPVALVLHSPGGDAKSAYRIATVLRRRCGAFDALVPRYAKSAATLLSLGARRIVMAPFAELGPLDAQVDDPEREEGVSALDEVQALERLHSFSLEAVDRTLHYLMSWRKKMRTVLPHANQLVIELLHPMFEKIDAVHYTQMSRILKVAEEYAVRLLRPHYSEAAAQKIARRLVENYPDHGFVIDRDEASRVGLGTEDARPDVARLLTDVLAA